MTHATITVELRADDLSGDRLLHSLRQTLTEHCTGITCSIIRKEEFPISDTFDEGVALTVQNVKNVPPVRMSNPDSIAWSVYLSPRRFHFFMGDAPIRTSLSGALMAVAFRGTPVGIFLHTITTKDIPESIAFTLYHKMETARRDLIAELVSPNQLPIVHGFSEAIAHAYKIAFSPSLNN